MSKTHIRYGAVGFKTKASPSQINRFVRDLPYSKRQSMYQVAEELKSAGLIEPTGDITHEHCRNITD